MAFLRHASFSLRACRQPPDSPTAAAGQLTAVLATPSRVVPRIARHLDCFPVLEGAAFNFRVACRRAAARLLRARECRRSSPRAGEVATVRRFGSAVPVPARGAAGTLVALPLQACGHRVWVRLGIRTGLGTGVAVGPGCLPAVAAGAGMGGAVRRARPMAVAGGDWRGVTAGWMAACVAAVAAAAGARVHSASGHASAVAAVRAAVAAGGMAACPAIPAAAAGARVRSTIGHTSPVAAVRAAVTPGRI